MDNLSKSCAKSRKPEIMAASPQRAGANAPVVRREGGEAARNCRDPAGGGNQASAGVAVTAGRIAGTAGRIAGTVGCAV